MRFIVLESCERTMLMRLERPSWHQYSVKDGSIQALGFFVSLHTRILDVSTYI
jgi:hypothetical protein